MDYFAQKIFVCFAAEDRYSIVEPIVYHLKNYGISTWYDRHALLMGDNRQVKNLDEGASKCRYALAILSKNTSDSVCAMEELSIVESRYSMEEMTVFPVLYELSPHDIPSRLNWVSNLIFKETDRRSGTREICNHIACKLTSDNVNRCKYRSIQDNIASNPSLSSETQAILRSYQRIDSANLNSRISLLYAAYLTIISSIVLPHESTAITMAAKIFERLFSETQLNLDVDYRELWLLENSICILADYSMESNI